MRSYVWRVVCLMGLGLAVLAMGSLDPNLVEGKVQSDLDGLLSHLLPKAQYLVQVNTAVDTDHQKQLVEGETTVESAGTSPIVVPPLPGFQPDPPKPKVNPPEQSHQVYKMVDVPILKSVAVNLTLDERLSQGTASQAEQAVRDYLSANFPSTGRLQVTHARMLEPRAAASESGNSWLGSILPWGIVGLLALMLFLRLRPWERPARPRPVEVRPIYDSVEEALAKATPQNTAAALSGSPAKPLALPAGDARNKQAFPSLPATAEFVDQRSKLLEIFLKDSETFRLYFQRLGEAAQNELYAGMRGPAFDSLLESLGLETPKGGAMETPPSEEQMLFYEKNFGEFVQAQAWQNSQFFGFLHRLSDEQCVALVRHESPMVGSLMLKFMKPAQSAAVLQLLSSKERQDILSQSALSHRVSTSELLAIEEAVRADVARLPKFLIGSTKEDVEFWTKVLSQADRQDEILLDLERTRPELYQSLARFRFHLEDTPALPRPLLEKVLGETDNEELALALTTCSQDVASFILSELGAKRRELISHQLAMYRGMSSEKTGSARAELTRRFREVMA